MKTYCYHHSKKEAINKCNWCERSLCEECLIENKNKKYMSCKNNDDCLAFQSGEFEKMPKTTDLPIETYYCFHHSTKIAITKCHWCGRSLCDQCLTKNSDKNYYSCKNKNECIVFQSKEYESNPNTAYFPVEMPSVSSSSNETYRKSDERERHDEKGDATRSDMRKLGNTLGKLGIGKLGNTLTWGEINAMLICPHCQNKGKVRTKKVNRKKGISGGKTTGAILTGGLSILATGLSRKEAATQAHCGNCNSTWEF
jgi:hypothetical protein